VSPVRTGLAFGAASGNLHPDADRPVACLLGCHLAEEVDSPGLPAVTEGMEASTSPPRWQLTDDPKLGSLVASDYAEKRLPVCR
jgi:hypothetical protein